MHPSERPMVDAAPRILVAEDSPTQAQRLKYILSQHGYDVHIVGDGRQALEHATAQPPALIISDVVMPEVDGYELTRLIKASPRLRTTPVILVTTMSDPQDVIRGLECGADSFILKPYDEQYLVARVRYILLNHELRRANDGGMGVEIHFNGQRHYITADRLQILNLLLSTYEAAIQRNQELSESKEALQRTTEEVLAGHRFLDSMFENIPVAIIIVDVAGLHYVRLNRAAEIMMGRPRDELIGKTAFDIFPADQAEQFTAQARQVLDRGTVEDIPWTEVDTVDQGVRTVRTRLVPVLDAYGDASHLLIMREDITEAVRANAELSALNDELLRKTVELERARQEAEEASRAKSAFLAAMSHEIRTPMNGVIGMVDVLQQSSLMSHQQEMVDLIRESAFSLLGVIEDILDFSKIEAGKLEIESAPMAVADVVEKACGLLDNLAVKKGVELRLYIDPAIPAQVLGDTLRVRQVVLNLVNNAIKFSGGLPHPGRVCVRVGVAGRSRTQITLELRVSDNGIGMDEQTQARLFTAFTQADASTTRRFGGTGLGLAISSHLVKLMGGRIAVTSVPQAGSTFTVWLPCAPLPRPVRHEEARPPLLAGLQCVVVGPADGAAHDHATYLEHAGATVEAVPDLPAARAWTLAHVRGMVIWVVDAGSGYAEALRATGHLPEPIDLRLVVISSEAGQRRLCYADDSGRVARDGGMLTYHRLVTAVVRAAGRMEPEPETRSSARSGLIRAMPTHRQAMEQGRLVLVAEDSEANQKVILHQLRLLGIASDIVGDGETALARWRSGDYALLLTDLHMPVMDGYQLAAAIRREESGERRTPIVALSANTIKDEAQRCLALGMDDYLSKPVQLTLLRHMMEKWLPDDGQSATRVDAPPVDVQVLKTLVGDDPDVLDEFLRDFGVAARQAAGQIGDAWRAGDTGAVAAAAHKLKSSARSVGAAVLGELCEALEREGHAGRAEALAALLPKFDDEIARVGKYLDAS